MNLRGVLFSIRRWTQPVNATLLLLLTDSSVLRWPIETAVDSRPVTFQKNNFRY